MKIKNKSKLNFLKKLCWIAFTHMGTLNMNTSIKPRAM